VAVLQEESAVLEYPENGRAGAMPASARLKSTRAACDVRVVVVRQFQPDILAGLVVLAYHGLPPQNPGIRGRFSASASMSAGAASEYPQGHISI